MKCFRQRLVANLKPIRTAESYTQEQFAFEAGIHRIYINDLERGARNPTIGVVQRLADCLGVEAGELIS